jgi:predicted aspartyl protease
MCRRPVSLVLTAIAAGSVLAGCGSGGHSAAKRTSSARSLSVPLTVYRSHGLVIALVRLTLEGHPYDFIVDTGAARTFIDARVASRLGLRDGGSPREFWTLGCQVSAQPVALRSWRLGDASFSTTTVFTQRLLIPRVLSRFPVAGLLGSDFLSRWGKVTIDLTHRRLILGGSTRTGTGGHAVPIKILRLAGGTWATTQVELDHHRSRFLVDTGAAISVIDSSAAARLRLQAAGPRVSVTGAVCRSTVTPVLVHGWSIAVLHIPRAVIGRASEVLPERVLREGIVGIVGMATLSRFGVLTIDYSHARMILGGSGD